MDEERYTWIERDNHHVCVYFLRLFQRSLLIAPQILGQLAKVTEASQSPSKQVQYKHRSMLADGQRKVKHFLQ